MRLLGYTRVSTAGQDDRLQLDALVGAGVQKRDVFTDVTSGTRAGVDRPGMAKLLAYAEAGDTVVVWRVDRLGRSLIDVLNTVNVLRERGVHLRSITDAIDPATPGGRVMLNMLATLAEYERDLIVERVNAGIAAARNEASGSAGPSPTRWSLPTSSRSPEKPARKAAQRRTQPNSLAGAGPPSTGTSRLSAPAGNNGHRFSVSAPATERPVRSFM